MSTYLGSYTRHTSQGVYEYNDQKLSLLIECANPTYLTQTDQFLYSIFGSENGCGVIIYDKTTHRINQQVFSDEKGGPCHIYVNEQLGLMVTSNYHEHAFHVYRKQEDQWQLPIRIQIDNDKSRIHYAYYSILDEALYVVDLGLDKIYKYRLDQYEQPYETIDFPTGTGVRHCVFTKDEQTMFALTEYSGEIFMYRNNQLVYNVQTNPQHQYNEAAAAIRLSPNEEFVAVSIRASHEIVVYKVENEKILEIDRFGTQGEHPRDFNFLDNETILCANRDTNNLSLFKRDGKFKLIKQIDASEIVCVTV